jgi:crotonobetainyl-CoA:carnitine CoA-transferase CaiB-like acyl-CoA transferase
MIQGMSGIMSLTGEPNGEPQKIGVAFADIFTGVYGVIAVQAALAQRERTGRGQHVDMALLDVMVGVLANQAMNYLVSGQVPHRYGNAHPNIVPYQVCTVADGHVMLAVGNDGQFQRLCTVLVASDLAQDPRYQTNEGRVIHRTDLMPALGTYLSRWTRDALLAQLATAAVPAGPINTVADVFADPQVQFRGMQLDLPAPAVAGGRMPGVRTPIAFSDATLKTQRPAPQLGQHTDEVRREYGFAPTDHE